MMKKMKIGSVYDDDLCSNPSIWRYINQNGEKRRDGRKKNEKNRHDDRGGATCE